MIALNQENLSLAWLTNNCNLESFSSCNTALCRQRCALERCSGESRRFRSIVSLRGGAVEISKEDSVTSRLVDVKNQISAISEELKRPPPRLIAVSKFQSEESILEAYNAGQVMK